MTFTGRISDYGRGYSQGYENAINGSYTEWGGSESDAFLAGYDEGWDHGVESPEYDGDLYDGDFDDEVLS